MGGYNGGFESLTYIGLLLMKGFDWAIIQIKKITGAELTGNGI